jgi:hypothetical protein
MNPDGTGKTFVRSLLSTDFPDSSGARPNATQDADWSRVPKNC